MSAISVATLDDDQEAVKTAQKKEKQRKKNLQAAQKEGQKARDALGKASFPRRLDDHAAALAQKDISRVAKAAKRPAAEEAVRIVSAGDLSFR